MTLIILGAAGWLFVAVRFSHLASGPMTGIMLVSTALVVTGVLKVRSTSRR